MTRAEVSAPTRMAHCCHFGRGADQVAGLEVLRCGAAVGRRDADHRRRPTAPSAGRPGSSSPAATKIRQVSSSVATVMPEIGLDDEPISPVSRDDTVTNRKPNSTIRTAPSRCICRSGTQGTTRCSGVVAQMPPTSSERADADQPQAAGRGRCALPAAPPLAGRAMSLNAGPDRTDDQRQRLEQADDAAGRHGAGADVEDVFVPDLVLAHVADELGGRIQRSSSGCRRTGEWRG